MTRVRLVLLVTGALAGCDLVDTRDSGFSMRTDDEQLILKNALHEPVHYVAMEEETSALVDLYPDPTTWPSVAPGTEKYIPYRELMGYHTDATHARVYWWTKSEGFGTHIVTRL